MGQWPEQVWRGPGRLMAVGWQSVGEEAVLAGVCMAKIGMQRKCWTYRLNGFLWPLTLLPILSYHHPSPMSHLPSCLGSPRPVRGLVEQAAASPCNAEPLRPGQSQMN